MLKLLKHLPALARTADDLKQKAWYTSKTIWLNLLLLAGAIASDAFGALPIEAADYEGLAIGAVAVANIVLRLVTSTAVGRTSVRHDTSG